MFKKAVTVFTLVTFVSYVSLADLAGQEKVPKPTLQEIFDNYSFLETADLSLTHSFDKKEIEKELKKLEEKEKAEKLQAIKEQTEAKTTLKNNQNRLKQISSQMTKIRTGYTGEEAVIQDGKTRRVPKVDYDGLNQDKEYATLAEERKKLECQIKEWQVKSDANFYKLKQEKIRVHFDVLKAQLDILQNWPGEIKKIDEEIASGKSAERKFSDPENIGLRDLGFGNPAEDTKYLQNPQLQQIIEDIRKNEYQNPAVRSYIVGLVKTVLENSDLKMPIDDKNIIITPEEDINASAWIGGILTINRGLLKEAENEAQLVGVLSHEISHLAARHSHRLNKKAGIADILMQAAYLAAILVVPGGIGMYYAIQYGFSGLGFLISLKFLGVSRGFELEADTLGMQYLHKMGYDPMSFMNFFEKMGRNKGYVRHTSWFRTHPAFVERITNAFRELHFLEPKAEYVSNTTAFLEMQARICVDEEIEKTEVNELTKNQYRPTLRRGEQKKEEQIEKDCGLQKPQIEHKQTACDNPALETYKQKIREEIAKEKEREEKGGIKLKRPPKEEKPF